MSRIEKTASENSRDREAILWGPPRALRFPGNRTVTFRPSPDKTEIPV